LVGALVVVLSACGTPVPANPASCSTNAHDPHPSGHVSGTINAEIRQSCTLTPTSVRAKAQLWENRWWGYDQIGTPGDVTRHGVRSVSAFASAPCRNNSIRVTGTGHYLWGSEWVNSIEVSNTKDVNC
jgi:hypothetical protein